MKSRVVKLMSEICTQGTHAIGRKWRISEEIFLFQLSKRSQYYSVTGRAGQSHHTFKLNGYTDLFQVYIPYITYTIIE